MVHRFAKRLDERAQQVYSIIDKSRAMRLPFNELSLMDYAINTCPIVFSQSNIGSGSFKLCPLIERCNFVLLEKAIQRLT